MLESYIKIPDDKKEFYLYLRDYIQKSLKEEYQSTENVVKENILKKHMEDLIHFGIINTNQNENEYALWGNNQYNSIFYSIISLIEIGIINGGLSYLLHQYGLCSYIYSSIEKEIKSSLEFPFWVVVQGNYGLARNLLAKYLYTHSISDPQTILDLKRYFDLPNPVIMQIPDFISYFSFFTISENTKQNNLSLNLAKIQMRKQLNPSHGLEEIKTSELEYEVIETISFPSLLFVDLLSKHILGNLAISTGRLIYSINKALKYTNERIQGGKLIYNYPAIQNLIFNAESILDLALNSLFQCCNINNEKELLLKVLRIKKILMPLILQGISDCLQTHGGYGYMRDYGLEKAYRDVNHLKQLDGTSFEISLFLGEVYQTKQSELQPI